MEVKSAPNVKLVIGLIYSKTMKIDPCLYHLERTFGPIDLRSPVFDFNVTDYYEDEMGKKLKREFISFKKLIGPQKLPEIKRITNIIEKDYADDLSRQINLDPGYLDMDKFVLASAKYGRQKIFLDKGIYADPTLYFFKKTFHAHDWSFPDFKSGIYNEYFMKVRQEYKIQVKSQ
jgi:hypothetical protein